MIDLELAHARELADRLRRAGPGLVLLGLGAGLNVGALVRSSAARARATRFTRRTSQGATLDIADIIRGYFADKLASGEAMTSGACAAVGSTPARASRSPARSSRRCAAPARRPRGPRCRRSL